MTLTELEEIKKNYKVLEIAVDFINPSYNISRAKHLDTARYIVCTLTQNGIPRNVKTNEAARIRLQKPDRTYVYNDCDVLEDGRVFVTLTEQILSVEGNAICDIQLTDEETGIIYSTQNFLINIDKVAVDNSVMESSNEFGALNNLIATNKKLNEELATNEEIREENEAERIANEETRQENENVRIANESTRQKNETVRQTHETDRENNTAAAIANAEIAAKNAQDAADDLQAKLDAHHFVLTEDKDIADGVPSLDSNAKVPIVELYDATTTGKGITQLTDSVTSSSITTAATPNSVKTVNDALITEKNRATNAESTLTTNLNNEIIRATTAENNLSTTKANIASPIFTGTPAAPTASAGTNTTQIATTAFVQTAVSNGIAASDAMIIKGTIGTNGTVTALPNTYQTGWTYRVVTAGTYAGQICEIGDLVIALVNRSGSGNLDSDWCVAQTNINGAITGIKSGDAYITISQSGSVVTITHADVVRNNTTSTASPSHGSTFVAIDSITSDSKGHVTGVNTKTVTLPTYGNVVGSSTATSNTTTALTNGNVYLNSVENGAVTSSHKISGSGATSVTTDTSGNIIISSSGGSSTEYSVATASADGLMSAEDKAKLDGITESADTKVTNTLAATTKAYLTGTTSSATNTGTQVFDTDVYLTATAGQLNATTFTENGTLLSNKYRYWRYACVGQSIGTSTNPYYKFAEISTSTAYNDLSITFKVYVGFNDSSTCLGILTAHFRTNDSGCWDSGQLIWEYAVSGIDTSKFILAHNTSVSPSAVELWACIDSSYRHYHFDVISEGSRNATNNSLWTLYTTSSAGSQASITDGYATITSTLATLKNSISGNASTASTATKLGTSTIGNGTQPMYLNAGTPTASTSTVGSSTQPVYLNAGVVTAGTYTLGAACAKSVTDSSSASAISTGTSLVTERDVYYGLPTINGSHTYTSSTSIYAPTAVGTSGYVLKSNGSGTPSWASLGSLTAGANAAFSSVTVSSGNYTSLGSVTLEPGRYVLVGYAAIGSVGNSITAVQLFWSTNSSDWGPDRYSTRLGGLSDGLVIPDIQNVRILNPTTTTTYYLVAYHGGGTGTTTVNGAYGYLRISG